MSPLKQLRQLLNLARVSINIKLFYISKIKVTKMVLRQLILILSIQSILNYTRTLNSNYMLIKNPSMMASNIKCTEKNKHMFQCVDQIKQLNQCMFIKDRKPQIDNKDTEQSKGLTTVDKNNLNYVQKKQKISKIPFESLCMTFDLKSSGPHICKDCFGVASLESYGDCKKECINNNQGANCNCKECKICKACDIKNCLLCEKTDTSQMPKCNQCMPGYMKDLRTGGCTRCPRGCYKCFMRKNETKCSSCLNNFLSEKVDNQTVECKECPRFCQSCKLIETEEINPSISISNKTKELSLKERERVIKYDHFLDSLTSKKVECTSCVPKFILISRKCHDPTLLNIGYSLIFLFIIFVVGSSLFWICFSSMMIKIQKRKLKRKKFMDPLMRDLGVLEQYKAEARRRKLERINNKLNGYVKIIGIRNKMPQKAGVKQVNKMKKMINKVLIQNKDPSL